jgi:hypothetical protein
LIAVHWQTVNSRSRAVNCPSNIRAGGMALSSTADWGACRKQSAKGWRATNQHLYPGECYAAIPYIHSMKRFWPIRHRLWANQRICPLISFRPVWRREPWARHHPLLHKATILFNEVVRALRWSTTAVFGLVRPPALALRVRCTEYSGQASSNLWPILAPPSSPQGPGGSADTGDATSRNRTMTSPRKWRPMNRAGRFRRILSTTTAQNRPR